MFGEWYQKTHETDETNKLTLLTFKIIAILKNTRLATFIKFLETVSKGLFRNRSQNVTRSWIAAKCTNYQHAISLISAGATEGHFTRKIQREVHQGGFVLSLKFPDSPVTCISEGTCTNWAYSF
jgi:hypothetical protein